MFSDLVRKLDDILRGKVVKYSHILQFKNNIIIFKLHGKGEMNNANNLTF